MFAIVDIPMGTADLLQYITNRFPHLDHWNVAEKDIQVLSPSSRVMPPTNLSGTKTYIPCSYDQADGESGLRFFGSVSSFSSHMKENWSSWQENDNE